MGKGQPLMAFEEHGTV